MRVICNLCIIVWIVGVAYGLGGTEAVLNDSTKKTEVESTKKTEVESTKKTEVELTNESTKKIAVESTNASTKKTEVESTKKTEVESTKKNEVESTKKIINSSTKHHLKHQHPSTKHTKGHHPSKKPVNDTSLMSIKDDEWGKIGFASTWDKRVVSHPWSHSYVAEESLTERQKICQERLESANYSSAAPTTLKLINAIKEKIDESKVPTENGKCKVDLNGLVYHIRNAGQNRIINDAFSIVKEVMGAFAADSAPETKAFLLFFPNNHVTVEKNENYEIILQTLDDMAKKENVNLVTVVVDWKKFSDEHVLTYGVNCIEPLARGIAELFDDQLVITNNIAKLTIGDGVGATLAASVGRNINVRFNYMLAIDPTWLCLAKEEDLHAENAFFAEALRTSVVLGYPKTYHLGRTNIFIGDNNNNNNNSTEQAKCKDQDDICNHNTALQYIAEICRNMLNNNKTPTVYKRTRADPTKLQYNNGTQIGYEFGTFIKKMMLAGGNLIEGLPAYGIYSS